MLNNQTGIASLLHALFAKRSNPIPADNPHETPNGIDALRDQLYQQIMDIRCKMMDGACAIQSDIFTLNEQPIWTREIDARNLASYTDDAVKTINYNYLRIFYAYLIAAITLCKVENIETGPEFAGELLALRNKTQDIFMRSMQNVTFDNDKAAQLISESKGELISILKKYSAVNDEKIINSMLDKGKNWVALEKESLPIITTIHNEALLPGKRIVIVDRPCSQLTPAQREQFTDMDQKAWYKELSAFDQKLITYYAPNILSNKCVVPSQLRAVVPTSKNSFNETIWIEENGELQLINDYYHSGTAAYLSHKNDKIALEITENNLQQQKQNSATDAMLMISLNSEMADWVVGPYEFIRGNKYISDDSKIIQLTSQAADKLKDKNIFSAKICLNGFRLIEFNDYRGINAFIEIVKANLCKIDPHLLAAREIGAMILKVLTLKAQTADRDVKGLDIVYLLTKIATLNNKLVFDFPNNDLKHVAVWFGCASGQNRTGITYFNNICQSIIDYAQSSQKITFNREQQLAIRNMIALTQHVLVMTGNQGGTFGAEGIRSKSSFSFKKQDPSSLLVTRPADLKLVPAEDHTFNEAWLALKTQLQQYKNDPLRKDIWNWANKFADHAYENRKTVATMNASDKITYANALKATADILKEPNDAHAFTQLSRSYNKLSSINEFKGTKHRNFILATTGIVLGCLGAALMAASLITLAFGVTAPVSISGMIIASAMVSKALLLTGAALSGGMTLCGGVLTQHSLFQLRSGPIDYVAKVHGAAVKGLRVAV